MTGRDWSKARGRERMQRQGTLAHDADPRPGPFGHLPAHRSKRPAAPPASTVAMPIAIDEWAKNSSSDVFRVRLDRFNGRDVVDLRVWWMPDDGDERRPGKAGLTCAVRHLPRLSEAIGKALAEARRLGLIDDGDAT